MPLPTFESGSLPTEDGAVRPYVMVGGGPRRMVVVPGAADGILTCVDVAVYLAWFYRRRAESCRLLLLSRRDPIPESFDIQRHAEDMIRTVEEVGFGPAVWECISMAGLIGQRVAVQRPDLVQGLILSSSYDHVADRTKQSIEQWLALAERNGGDLFSRMVEQKYRPPDDILALCDPSLLAGISSTRPPERLQRLLRELPGIDQRSLAAKIKCPTLVIGGLEDRIVPPAVQRDMAARIPASSLALCPDYGHFNDMENPEYETHVARFVERVAGRAE